MHEAVGRRLAITPVLGAVIAIVALGCLLHIHYAGGELIDDAYISFRYAQNLTTGHGLVFNVGERVEGYTNFLWVILLAGPALLGFDVPMASQILGALCALLAVWTTTFLLPAESGLSWRRLLAPALLATNATFAMWAVHGLETALFTLLVAAGVRADLYAQSGRGRPFSSSFWWALATLTRPEGAVLFAASLTYQVLTRRARWVNRRGWLGPLLYVAIVAPHVLWRLTYYGYPFPNTFYAKAGLSWPLVERGVTYVAGFFSGVSSLPWLVLLPAAVRARHEAPLRYLFWIASVYLAAVVLEGGDFFPAFRFIVPIYPVLYTLVQEGTWTVLAALRENASERVHAIATLATVLLWLPHAAAMQAHAETESAGSRTFTGGLKMAALALKQHCPPGTTIAANPVGALAYYSELPVIDLLGLTDVHIAHAAVDLGTGIIAHEKGDGAYVFARKPDVFLVGNVLIKDTPPATFMRQSWPAWLKSEGEFVQQPELKDWYERDVLQLSDGRYLYFLKRKGVELRP